MPEKTLLQSFTEALIKVENPKLESEAEVKTKSGYNYKYKYASLGECMRVVKEACTPLGLAVWFDVKMTFDNVDGEVITAHTVETVVSNGKEEKRLAPVPAKLNGLPQSNGSEITYAKRYSLSAAFGLVSEEDDDAQRAQNAYSLKNRIDTPEMLKLDRKVAQNELKKVLVEYYGGDKETAKDHFNSLWQEPGFSDTAEYFTKIKNELITEMRANG